MYIFLIKLLDTMIGTAKNITTYKGMKFLSALLTSISQIFFIVIVKQTNSNMPILLMIAYVFVATFIGTYISFSIFDLFEKDKIFKVDITPNNNDTAKDFVKLLLDHDFTFKADYYYTDDCILAEEPVLCMEVFTKTKEQTKLLLELTPDDFKYNINVPREAKTVKRTLD